jgi:hypothetical protein
MTTTPDDPATALPGRPPVRSFRSARRPTPARATPSPRPLLGPDQPPRTAVDPPRRDPRGDLGRHGHHRLTR